MAHMMKMFGASRQESLRREESLRDDMACAIGTSTKNTSELATQVKCLTNTVSSLRAQLGTNTEFSVDAIHQVRAELRSEVGAEFNEKTAEASNAGGGRPGSANDPPLVNNDGKPRELAHGETSPCATSCAYCNGSIPKVIAKHCIDCDLYFHPGHYQNHRDDWPCPIVDPDLCHWCEHHINEEENMLVCQVCLHELHAQCFVDHNPCPNGWTKNKNLGDHGVASTNTPAVVEPVTPTSKSTRRDKAAELFNTFQDGYTQYVAAMDALANGDAQENYPTSPGHPGTLPTTFGSLPLANLGIAPGATGHSGHVVQYGKPKEADSVKLLAFPKPGMNFEKWWDHAMDSISSSTSYCTEAYR